MMQQNAEITYRCTCISKVYTRGFAFDLLYLFCYVCIPQRACQAMTFLVHYFLLVAHLWLLCKAAYLFRQVRY